MLRYKKCKNVLRKARIHFKSSIRGMAGGRGNSFLRGIRAKAVQYTLQSKINNAK